MHFGNLKFLIQVSGEVVLMQDAGFWTFAVAFPTQGARERLRSPPRALAGHGVRREELRELRRAHRHLVAPARGLGHAPQRVELRRDADLGDAGDPRRRLVVRF